MFGERLLIISSFLIISASGSALHGVCTGDEQCGTFDTYCKHGICVCIENFGVVSDTCVQFTTPRVSCKKKNDCVNTLGSRSLCKDGQCACRSFHHLYNNQCIKSRGLDEVCEFDHQCYCGQHCNEKIECSNGICTCKEGFKRHNRRCIGDLQNTRATENNTDITKYSVALLIVTLFFVKVLL